jgi:hypothetical protein
MTDQRTDEEMVQIQKREKELDAFIVDLYNFIPLRIEYVNSTPEHGKLLGALLEKRQNSLKDRYKLLLLNRQKYLGWMDQILSEMFDTAIWNYKVAFAIYDDRVCRPSNIRYGFNQHHSHPQ